MCSGKLYSSYIFYPLLYRSSVSALATPNSDVDMSVKLPMYGAELTQKRDRLRELINKKKEVELENKEISELEKMLDELS